MERKFNDWRDNIPPKRFKTGYDYLTSIIKNAAKPINTDVDNCIDDDNDTEGEFGYMSEEEHEEFWQNHYRHPETGEPVYCGNRY